MKEDKRTNTRKGSEKGRIKLVALATLLIIGLLIGGFFFLRARRDNSADIVDKVSRLYLINDRTKAKAIEVKDVSDEQKKGSSVYKDIKPGDYFVQLEDTKRVIVYRPSENKILRVDPLIEQKFNNN
jgi:hypothetical protein